jgi:hypothetical protein
MGGYAGNRLGAIRDAKGKSVMAVCNITEGTLNIADFFNRSSIPWRLIRKPKFLGAWLSKFSALCELLSTFCHATHLGNLTYLHNIMELRFGDGNNLDRPVTIGLSRSINYLISSH